MGEWLLGLIGIAFAGVILDVILPSGRTKGIIQCVFAIFSLYVIIAPLPDLFSSTATNANQTSIEMDEEFLYSTNSQIITALENTIIQHSKTEGLDGVSVVIWADLSKNEIDVEKVYVDLTNAVLSEDKKNINKYEVLTEIVQSHVNVSKEDITFYG